MLHQMQIVLVDGCGSKSNLRGWFLINNWGFAEVYFKIVFANGVSLFHKSKGGNLKGNHAKKYHYCSYA